MKKIIKNIAFVALILAAVWPAQVGAMESKKNSKNYSKEKTLFKAVEAGNLPKVKECIENGADVNAIEKKGSYNWYDYNWTPLHRACWDLAKDPVICLKIVAYLIAHGANVDGIGTGVKAGQTGDRWQSPLHLAAQRGSLLVVELLIENGAKINVIDGKWATANGAPLSSACNHWDVVQYLIEKGANIDTQNLLGETALHRRAATNDYLYDTETGKNDNLYVMQILIHNHANINAKDRHKRSPLHIAAKEGNLPAVKLLVENGADLGVQTLKNKTALQLAEKHNNQDIVDYLTLATALNEARQDPAEKFDAFAQTYLELANPQEASKNLTTTIGIISSYSTTQNPEFFEKFFAWMKAHNHLKHFKDKHEVKPDMKWFYLDLAYQAKNKNVHVKHAWLKKCFEYIETTTSSAFDAAVAQFITEQKIRTKKLAKIKTQNEQERWAAILNEKNKSMDQKKMFETCKDKMVVNKIIIPATPSLFEKENKKKNFFDDIDLHFADK